MNGVGNPSGRAPRSRGGSHYLTRVNSPTPLYQQQSGAPEKPRFSLIVCGRSALMDGGAGGAVPRGNRDTVWGHTATPGQGTAAGLLAGLHPESRGTRGRQRMLGIERWEKEQHAAGHYPGQTSWFWMPEISAAEGIGSRSSTDCSGEIFLLSTTLWVGRALLTSSSQALLTRRGNSPKNNFFMEKVLRHWKGEVVSPSLEVFRKRAG